MNTRRWRRIDCVALLFHTTRTKITSGMGTVRQASEEQGKDAASVFQRDAAQDERIETVRWLASGPCDAA